MALCCTNANIASSMRPLAIRRRRAWRRNRIDDLINTSPQRGEQVTLPSELPVEMPTKYESVINLQTAKTLGLTIPKSFLLRADEMIE
jgi:hypothetical protein